jgi:hypothetical protein
VGDAKTFLNNMIRNGDWANFALRCDEAKTLRELAVVLPVAGSVEPIGARRSPFERTQAERRESALGLARFKVLRGQVAEALAIAQKFGITRAELGLNRVVRSLALTLEAV